VGYFSDAEHGALLSDPIDANPAYVQQLFNAVSAQFRGDIGGADQNGTLSTPLVAACFACVCAFDLKPYGPEPSTGVDMATLLGAPALACDDYVRLTLEFMKRLSQCAGLTVAAVGWNGGAVGNHAQLFVTDPSVSETMLLDPTIGFLARDVTYDMVASGKPCPAATMSSFLARTGRNDPNISSFSVTVETAVCYGQYKPSDAFFYCSSLAALDAMYNGAPASVWLTPQAAKYQPA
jgi:hypothetical protein